MECDLERIRFLDGHAVCAGIDIVSNLEAVNHFRQGRLHR